MIKKEFSEISLSKAGILTTGYYGAYFKLISDLHFLFPYLNSTLDESRFYDRPEYLQFFFDGIKCTLYPKEMIASCFTSEQAAVTFFHHLMDFIEDIYNRRNEIEANYKKYNPPSVIDILKLVPQSNCRACGYATCMAFAAALRNEETTPDGCPHFAVPIVIKKTYPILDIKGNLVSTVTIDQENQEDLHTIPVQESTANSSANTQTSEKRDDADHSISDDLMAYPPLTRREIEVIKLLTTGSTNTGIAEALGISPHTVKSHVVHIFNKLGVNDRTQAAVWATRYYPQICI